MQLRVEDMRRDGVAFAAAPGRFDLPVIDITHPRFAVPKDPEAARTLHEQFVAGERKRGYVPKFIMRWLLARAARQSLLVRSLFNSDATYLDGLSTYMMKLGTDNLVPPHDSPMDHRLAASPHVVLLRLRLQQTASLVADGLADELRGAGELPLHLINIGGGPAIDSLNTLILLRRDHPGLLKRRILIHVLDRDEAGPAFGANALAALEAGTSPLHGLDIVFQREAYDWNEPGLLARLLARIRSEGGVVAASSEGALFEYGSDEAIVCNLKVLREGGARLVAGSVTPADEFRRRMIATTRFKLVPRGIDGFTSLASRAGFAIARVERAFISDQVLLRPQVVA